MLEPVLQLIQEKNANLILQQKGENVHGQVHSQVACNLYCAFILIVIPTSIIAFRCGRQHTALVMLNVYTVGVLSVNLF